MRAPRSELLRLAAFGGLLLLGSLAWARQVAPTDTGAALAATGIGLAAALVLRASTPKSPRVRVPALALLVLAGLAASLLAAGVPVRLLWVREWDALGRVLADGLTALPTLTIPYRGLDDSVRVVLMAGAGVLALLAALLVYGRRRPAQRAPLAGGLVLGVLYGLPVVQRNPDHPLLSGAAFALLLAALLGAARLRGRVSLVTGAAAALGAVLLALVAAPVLNADEPWIDYQGLAGDLSERRAETFSWDHGYGALRWSRDGRELARIRASRPAYWKTANLDAFDGLRWAVDEPLNPRLAETDLDPAEPRWRQQIRVGVRDLRSSELIGAGTTLSVDQVPTGVEPAGGGTFRTVGRPLRAGDTYRADVYVPREDTGDLGSIRSRRYPFDLERYLSMGLPPRVGGPPGYGAAGPEASVAFGLFDDGAAPRVELGQGPFDQITGEQASAMLERSAYGRAFGLARRLRAQSEDPYDYLRRVGRRVRAGATYTESPAPAAVPLDAFLFDRREGYCQQFSGAMALLLRMGGVPARVASGFSPGTLDAERGEYVVRDLDAHSWVEAYFPEVGWVTFDPTPSDSPAAAQQSLDDVNTTPEGEATGDPGGDRPGQTQSGASSAEDTAAATDADEGSSAAWWVAALAVGALLALGAAGAAALRRPQGGPGESWRLAELRRALRLAGRPAESALTLAGLEQRLRREPHAQAYVRALRAARFGGDAEPDASVAARGRAALRRELAAGHGMAGRVRALVALPPRRA